nr:YhcH/YjgK/YiaL family protein [Enterocloster clostridioformis]
MIFSSINSLGRFYHYPATIRMALKWIRDHDIAHMDTGIYELQGRDIYVNIQDITTQPPQVCYLERHNDYLDIQYVVSGVERIGYAPYTGTETVLRENLEKDIVLYQTIENENFVNVLAGFYCVFFSDDIHRPGCAADGPEKVRKAVVKLKQSLI